MTTTQDIARAQALGRACARDGGKVSDCPYPLVERVMRRHWVLAFSRAGGARRLLGIGGRVRDWWA
jgi:hypothetical protein